MGHVGGRWRLIAHTSAPACLDVDGVLVGLLSRVELTDPELLAELAGVERPTVSTLVATWPRLEARTTPPRRIAVLAGSRRQRRHLEEVALRAGWLVSGGSADEMDLVALSRVVLSTQTAAVLLGADHSPAGDERRHLPDLAALAAAAKRLRPELTVILAGGAAAFESTFAGATDVGPAHVLAADPESRLASVVPEAAVLAPEVADRSKPLRSRHLPRRKAPTPDSSRAPGLPTCRRPMTKWRASRRRVRRHRRPPTSPPLQSSRRARLGCLHDRRQSRRLAADPARPRRRGGRARRSVAPAGARGSAGLAQR